MYSSQGNSKDQILSKKPKFLDNIQKQFMFLSACVFFSLILSISIATLYDEMSDNALQVILSVFYIVGIGLLIAIIIFLHINRFETFEEAGKDNSKAVSIFFSKKGEEVGYYLRFGIILIGILSIIYEVFDILKIKLGSDCIQPIRMFKIIAALIYFLIQAIFMLLYHSMIILKFTRWIHLGFYAVIFIDLITWEMGSLSKISMLTQNNKSSKCVNTIYNNYSIYFLPAVSEYCVIGIAVIHEIAKRTGRWSMIKTMEEAEDKLSLKTIERSWPGVIVGILLVLFSCTATGVVIYFHNVQKKNIDWVKPAHNGQEGGFYIIGLIMCIALVRHTCRMKFSFTFLNTNVDQNLLLASASCSICFSFLILIHSFADTTNVLMISRGLVALIEMIQIVFQTYLINDAFYRCCENLIIQKRKPGQNFIAILIGLNFGLWVLKSFQIKSGDVFFMKYEDGYEKVKKNILFGFFLYLMLPLSILYRYHSSSCLAEIYTKIYEDEINRIENVLRIEGFNQFSTDSINRTGGKEYGDDRNCNGSMNSNKPAQRQRSQSLNITINCEPKLMQRRRARPMTRRETIMNLEAAKLRVLSSHLSHTLVNRKLTASVTPVEDDDEESNDSKSTGGNNNNDKNSNNNSHKPTMSTIKRLVVTDLLSPISNNNQLTIASRRPRITFEDPVVNDGPENTRF